MSLEDYLFEDAVFSSNGTQEPSSLATLDTSSAELDAALQRLALPPLQITTKIQDACKSVHLLPCIQPQLPCIQPQQGQDMVRSPTAGCTAERDTSAEIDICYRYCVLVSTLCSVGYCVTHCMSIHILCRALLFISL